LVQFNLSRQLGFADGEPFRRDGPNLGRNPFSGETPVASSAAVGSHVSVQQPSRGGSGPSLPHSAEGRSRTHVLRNQGDPVSPVENSLRQADGGSIPEAVKEGIIKGGRNVPGSSRGMVEGNAPGQSDIGYRGCCKTGFCYRPALGSSNPMGSCASCPSVVDRCALWMTNFPVLPAILVFQ
jgi:hypothetical protein